MIVQIVLGVLLGLGVTIRVFFGKTSKKILHGQKKDTDAELDPTEIDPTEIATPEVENGK